MEREQGMIKGANEVCVLCFLLVLFSWFHRNCNIYFESRFLLSLAHLTPCTLPRVFASRQYRKFFFPFNTIIALTFSRFSPDPSLRNIILIMVPTPRCSPPAPNPKRWLNPLCKLIPHRKAERLTKDPATRLSTLRVCCN
jgi:hypothetical protein